MSTDTPDHEKPIEDVRGLLSAIRDEPCPEGWDHASGGAYTRTLWAPDAETANELDRALKRGLRLTPTHAPDCASVTNSAPPCDCKGTPEGSAPLTEEEIAFGRKLMDDADQGSETE